MDDLGRLRWGVLALLVVLAVASAGWALARNGDFEGAALNFGTELVGAVVTYALFELIIERRERREAEREAVEARKTRLIGEMGSAVNDVAVAAVEELRREGWLTDGSLEGCHLGMANLRGADLMSANLEGAFLLGANLEGAFLDGANLEGAYLEQANLERANLWAVTLVGADLEGVNLRGANLFRAELQEADLTFARMKGAVLLSTNLEQAFVSVEQLAQAQSLADATLPDGTWLSEDNWKAEFEEWREKQEEQTEQ